MNLSKGEELKDYGGIRPFFVSLNAVDWARDRMRLLRADATLEGISITTVRTEKQIKLTISMDVKVKSI